MKTLSNHIQIITTCCVWLHYLSLYNEDHRQQFTIGGCFLCYVIVGIAAIFGTYIL